MEMINRIYTQQKPKSIKLPAILVLLMLSVLSFGNVASASDEIGLPIGKLSVAASDAASSKVLANATVLVVNERAERVAKGLTNSGGVFEVKLPAGIYKVTVFADNHKEFGQVVTLTADQVTEVKANLQPNIRPSLQP